MNHQSILNRGIQDEQYSWSVLGWVADASPDGRIKWRESGHGTLDRDDNIGTIKKSDNDFEWRKAA